MSPQFYPTSDVTAGGWTTSPLWSKVDDLSESDIISSASLTSTPGTSGTCVLQLPAIPDPGINTGHVLRVRGRMNLASGSGLAGNINYGLRQNGVTIQSGTTNITATSYGTAEIPITSTAAANITDYGDLEIAFNVSRTAGLGGSVQGFVAGVHLEVPSPPSQRIPYLARNGHSYNTNAFGWQLTVETLHGNTATPHVDLAAGSATIAQLGVNPSGEGVDYATAIWVMKNLTAPSSAPYANQPYSHFSIWNGLNDLFQGITVAGLATVFQELKSEIWAVRARAQWEDTNTTVFGASAPTGWSRVSATDRNSGTGYTQVTSTGQPLTATIPADFDGDTVGVRFIGQDSTTTPKGGVFTILKNGVTVVSGLDTRGALVTQDPVYRRTTYTIEDVAPGDVLTITATTIDGSFAALDCILGAGGTDAPMVGIFEQPRLTADGYVAHGGGYGDTEIDALNAYINLLPAEFPAHEVRVVPMPLMAGDAAYYDSTDDIHPSATGHTYAADQFIATVLANYIYVSGGGQVQSSGTKGALRVFSVTGGGTVTSTGRKQTTNSVSITNDGAHLVVTPARISSSSVSITNDGAHTTASGFKGGQSNVTISGGGQIIAEVDADIPVFVDITVSGGGQITSTGTKSALQSVLVSSASHVVAVAHKSAFSTTTLSGGGNITLVIEQGNLARISGGGNLVVSVRKGGRGTLIISPDVDPGVVVTKKKGVYGVHAVVSGSGAVRVNAPSEIPDDVPNVVDPLLPHIPKRYFLSIRGNRVVRRAKRS